MLRAALAFLIVALIAGILGFSGIVETAIDFAEVLFLISLVLFGVGLVLSLLRYRVSDGTRLKA